MAELDSRKRDEIKKGDFAYVDKDGEGHLPIHDESHVRNAVARWNQTDFDSAAEKEKEKARKKIVAAAKKHDIEVGDDSNVAKSGRRKS